MPESLSRSGQVQQTLKNAIHCAGKGLHSGARIRMKLHPAEPDSGILFRRNGMPAFGIRAQLLPPAAPGERPRIRGVLHTLPRPDKPARPIAGVVGEFGVGDGGHGAFRALFVRMNDDGSMDELSDEDSRQIIGGIHGRFHDPRHDPSQADPGPFRGGWILCRRP